MQFRGSASNGVWGDWHIVLHDHNYTSYTVKKDGTGASGTWGINISGEASWTKQLKYQSNLTTIDNINAFHAGGTCRIACVTSEAGLDIGLSGKDGILISLPWSYNSYGAQLLMDDNSSGTVFIRGMDDGTWGNWHKFLHSGNYTTYFNPSNYVLKTGDTMTGKLQVNNVIVGYNYGNAGNNAAAFVFDKPGGSYTGFGPKQDSDGNGQQNTIHFGPCDSNGNWATEPFQRWMFYGDIYAGGGNDSYGIHPWINNYSTLGRENLYWWKAYVTYVYSNQVTGAVWNDYAEYRAQNELLIAGYIAYCDDDGKLKYTTERLQKFEGVVSDTFGFSIGETDECKTPLAVSGRVLVYCDPEDHFHSGDCVCAGPDGKAYRMTREEVTMYPDRIVGVVSEIPTYERWGTGNVEVNGRIWIKVK